MSYKDSEAWFMLKFLTILAVACVVGLAALMAVVNHAKFPGEVAQIEQLRKDVQKVSASGSEDVIGQATHWNQVIASYQRYNRTIFDPIIPDGWDSIALIAIP